MRCEDCFIDGVDRELLSRGRGVRLVAGHGRTKERVAARFDLLELDETLFHERSDDSAGVAQLAAKLLEQNELAIREPVHQLLLPRAQANALGILAGGGHLPGRVVRHTLTREVLGGFEKAIGPQPAHRPGRQRRSRGAEDLSERVHVVLRRLVQESQELRREHRLGSRSPATGSARATPSGSSSRPPTTKPASLRRLKDTATRLPGCRAPSNPLGTL